MINFERIILENGLRVLVHHDSSTPIVAMNILYDVGARDENPDLTGFAHLFEHLMFGGSVNIPVFDEPLENAGGENNAFTNNDFTNYYLTIPKQNLEMAFWLESDRMMDLAFTPKSLKVQKNVVIEEFKQRYLNQPYGDAWLKLKPLAYKVHPYQWSTIGKDISHIENAKMKDVKDFYKKFYNPSNGIMVIAGDVNIDEILKLSRKWFEPISAGRKIIRNLPKEPIQTEARTLTVKGDVPFDKIYKVFHMCSRQDMQYQTTDLLSDVLSNGKSSRLYEELVKKKQLFSDINAYISGDLDEGLFVFSGKLIKGISIQQAEEALQVEIERIKANSITERELQKVKNQIEANLLFSEMHVLNKAMNLAFFELMGNAQAVNTEVERYQKVTCDELHAVAHTIFREENSSTLFYCSDRS